MPGLGLVLCFACPWVLLPGLTGCAGHPASFGFSPVSEDLQARTSHSPATWVAPGDMVLPPGVVLEDGLSEDEAIETALTNNSTFQATLTQLGMAYGDEVQAGLVTNPSFLTFFPLGVKQWEWTLYVPLEGFLLRPKRMKVAEDEYQRVAAQLVQNGLNLVRDVRSAYADFVLAVEQARLAEEGVAIRKQVADLTARRLAAGDISQLEETTARVSALQADASAALLTNQVAVARSRLALLMGIPFAECQLVPSPTEQPVVPDLDVGALIDLALASRPDLRAAEWAVEAAGTRARLSRWLFLRFDGIADANSRGVKGYEQGPGLRIDIPIFNRNQGGVLRADAELEQALRNRDTIRDQIVQDVQTAVAQLRQARDSLAVLQNRVLPLLKDTIKVAENGYKQGGTTYFLVLTTTSQYLDSRAQMLTQVAGLRRAHAELERSVGHKLAPHPMPAPGLPPEQMVPEEKKPE